MVKRKLKVKFKEYFVFSQGERIGLIVLILLIGILLLVRFVIYYQIPVTSKVNVFQFEKEISRFEKVSDSVKKGAGKRPSTSGLLSSKRKNGLLGVRTIAKIEINSTDSTALEKLPGIGKVLASRIVKYRNKLGGFYSLDQLNEVYNLRPETVELIRSYLRADTTKIKKIAINRATFKEINAHPYLSYEQTKAIFRIRNRKPLVTLNQLVQFSVITPVESSKIRPYLTFE